MQVCAGQATLVSGASNKIIFCYAHQKGMGKTIEKYLTEHQCMVKRRYAGNVWITNGLRLRDCLNCDLNDGMNIVI